MGQLDNKCPNFDQVETTKYLNQCLSKYQTPLPEGGVETLVQQMHQDGRINPEITYWVLK
jgi:hypothetical protein